MDPEESKNQRKRREKKEMKLRLSLQASRSILFVTESTCLLIGCGGLANDVSREEMEGFLCQLHGFLELEMPISESFSFAKFASTETAAVARKVISGFILSTPRLEKRPSVTLVSLFVDESEWPSHDSEQSLLPEGLLFLEDYFNDAEEKALMDCVDWDASESDIPSCLKQRRVKHFGFEFIYGANNVDPSQPLTESIPRACYQVLDRLHKTGYLHDLPDQLTVNRYEPGQGIPPHVDTHSAFGDVIVSLSCGGQTVMDFREPNSSNKGCVVLKPRSALIFSGPARYYWTHGIASRKADLLPDEAGKMTLVPRTTRISFTFRKVLPEPKCNCIFKKQCDYQRSQKPRISALASGNSDNPSAIGDASSLEKTFVVDVYNSIADHFSSTRHSPWPRVSDFLKRLPAGSIVADVGCGNGKYLNGNQNLLYIASDISFQLCQIAFSRFASLSCVGGVMVADLLHLPLRSSSVDHVVCIAVLHHLASVERREKGIRELARVTRPGGQILITVWAFEQSMRGEGSKDSSYSYVKENREMGKEEVGNYSLPVHTNRTQFKARDMLVPWQKRKSKADEKETLHRYYHLFVRGELDEICEKTGTLKIVDSYYDKGNWAVIAEKIR